MEPQDPMRKMGCLPVIVMLLSVGFGGVFWISVILLALLPSISPK
jgi:hypothetical protein